MAALFALAVASAPAAVAGQQCSLDLRPFPEGAVTCQGGRQFRCVDGTWRVTGTTCAAATPGDGDAQVQPGVSVPVVSQPSVDRPAPPQVDRPGAP